MQIPDSRIGGYTGFDSNLGRMIRLGSRGRAGFGGGGGASLSLDFLRNEYFARDADTSWIDREGFADIITLTRASGGGINNSAGNYEFLGNDVPRLDYDPVTLQPKGLLIEEQRTNLLTYSADMTNAAWSKERGTWANTANAKFGSVGVFTEDSSAGTRIAARTTTLTSGVTYSHTEILKASGRDVVRLQIFTDGAVAADFNLTTGTVSAISGGTAQIIPLGDGWFACTVTRAITATAAYVVRFYPIVAGNASYTGDGREAFLHAGAQLEVGSFPTSYIPTTTAQVTRAADVASVNTLSPWYNATEGTLFVEFTQGQAAFGALGVAGRLISLGDGTSSNAIGILRADGGVQAAAAVGGATQVFLSEQAPHTGSGAITRSALAYKLDDYAFSVMGKPVLTDQVGAIPSVTALYIGQRYPGNGMANGHIRSIKYYPRRLSNSELQALTV